jgi:hypothetical protein
MREADLLERRPLIDTCCQNRRKWSSQVWLSVPPKEYVKIKPSEWLLDGQGNVIATPILSSTCGSGCSPPWRVVGVGDFNGDGYADVLWFNPSSRALSEWLLDGQGNVIATPILSRTCGSGCSPPWRVVGVGDFNGDGHADVLWFNASTGALGYWLLDGQGNVIATPILSRTCGSGCSPQ